MSLVIVSILSLDVYHCMPWTAFQFAINCSVREDAFAFVLGYNSSAIAAATAAAKHD